MNARTYNPSIPMNELNASPGEWILVDELDNVTASGTTLEAVVEVARQMKLDLSKLSIDRFPLENEEELLGVSEF